ncbi:MAG: hypothetical protein ABI864_05435 [Chloroflexota bacterium]
MTDIAADDAMRSKAATLPGMLRDPLAAFQPQEIGFIRGLQSISVRA